MKKSERMQKMADLNKNFESVAASAYAQAQSVYDMQLEQLEQLKIYRDEYRKRLKDRYSNAVTTTEIKDYRYFFKSLEDAIETQERLLEELDKRKETSRSQWLNRRNETRKLDMVTEKLKSREDTLAQRKEARENDELSQVLYNFHNRQPAH